MSRRTLIWIATTVGVVLFVLIGVVAAMLLRPPLDSNQTAQSTQSEFKGNVSDLSGGTISYRNLKGLTLRINQIDTCNPKVISAYVSVSAESGDVNKNFSKNDVKVYLDGKQINNFEFNAVDSAKLPLANILAIDHSGSMAGAAMDNAKSAATTYIDKLNSSDQVGVLQFDSSVDILAPISTDKQRAKSAIAGIEARGDTSMYDALNQSINAVPNCGRKAVTILTDGTDTSSHSATEASVTAQAMKANLPIFAVGIKGSTFDATSIRQIAEKTGGQYLEANTPSEISSLYGKIDSQLKGQFATNLTVTIPKDGSSHTLKIISNIEGSETGSERIFVY